MKHKIVVVYEIDDEWKDEETDQVRTDGFEDYVRNTIKGGYTEDIVEVSVDGMPFTLQTK